MTKYASRSEDHWIDVCAAHEPELVLPRQVSRQATSRNPALSVLFATPGTAV